MNAVGEAVINISSRLLFKSICIHVCQSFSGNQSFIPQNDWLIHINTSENRIKCKKNRPDTGGRSSKSYVSNNSHAKWFYIHITLYLSYIQTKSQHSRCHTSWDVGWRLNPSPPMGSPKRKTGGARFCRGKFSFHLHFHVMWAYIHQISWPKKNRR